MPHMFRRSHVVALLLAALLTQTARAENTVTLGGLTLINHGLVGVGRIDAALRDKFGETFGSGSGMAIGPGSWTRDGASWRGTIWLLPDRGYNVTGTIDYRARLNKIAIDFTPASDPAKLPEAARQRTVKARLADAMLLVDAGGTPLGPVTDVDTGANAGGRSVYVRDPDGHVCELFSPPQRPPVGS